MSKEIDIAVVGVTTLVGEALIELLTEQNIPVGKLYPLDGEDEAGGRVEFIKEQLRVEDVAGFDFSKAQLVFFTGTLKQSQDYVPVAAEQGCRVIDRTPAFRNVEQIPLVVAGVNDEAIKDNKVITIPCCIASMLTRVLKPVYDQVGIEEITVSTYQAVSGAGREGLEEVGRQTAALLNFKEIKTQTFPHQIAFNVIPQVGAFTESGYTQEEMKIINETRKVLNSDTLMMNVTAVRVPVFYGHSAALSVKTTQAVTSNDVKTILRSLDHVELTDEEDFNAYPTPVSDAANQETIYVGRVRQQPGCENNVELWLSADNIRACAAHNMLRIASQIIT